MEAAVNAKSDARDWTREQHNMPHKAAAEGALQTVLTGDAPRTAAATSRAELTRKFEAYIESRSESRRLFARRCRLNERTVTRVFPASDEKRKFFSRRTLQKISDATGGNIALQDLAFLYKARRPRGPKKTPRKVREDAPQLTQKFEAYLRITKETRAQFAKRLRVTPSWLSRVFPLDPNSKPRRISIDSALPFCRTTGGYLTLNDFHMAGLCPSMAEVIKHSAGTLAEAGSAEPNQASM
jgi:hypothetical protein